MFCFRCLNDSLTQLLFALFAALSSMSDEAFWSLSKETRELYIQNIVPRVDAAHLDALTFYREYVAKNRPVIIENAISHWPAIHKWNHAYLRNVLRDAVGVWFSQCRSCFACEC